jgi:hypothetical protein
MLQVSELLTCNFEGIITSCKSRLTIAIHVYEGNNHTKYFRSILKLFYHLCLDLPNNLFFSGSCQDFVLISCFFVHSTCHTHFICLDLISLKQNERSTNFGSTHYTIFYSTLLLYPFLCADISNHTIPWNEITGLVSVYSFTAFCTTRECQKEIQPENEI